MDHVARAACECPISLTEMERLLGPVKLRIKSFTAVLIDQPSTEQQHLHVLKWRRQMAIFSMDLESLRDLFVDELRDLYDAEKQITEALPKLIGKAENPQLKSALQEHLEVTRGQIQRLDRIFERLQEKPTGESCKGMKGLIKEGDDMATRDGSPSVIDAAIISSAQRVEHYEMAGYGTVRTYAELLGEREMANMLQQTLDEEKQADQALNEIAKTINVQARAA